MAVAVLCRQSSCNLTQNILFSTSSEVAIRAFQMEYDESSVSSKYKHSYIYQSKHTEEEDIPTAICVHQGSLYAGYVNNNFLIEFNIEAQKPVNSIQFQAETQISTNRYTMIYSESPPMGTF